VKVEPVAGERALEISAPKARYIVAGDLHVGIEVELERRGFWIPDQTERTLSRLVKLVVERPTDGLVLLGDVKHQFPFAGKYEARSVFRLLDALSKLLPVTVVTGNHDGGLARMAPESVERVSSLVIGGSGPRRPDSVGLVHGHSWPPEGLMRCRTLVMAHTHPSVRLCDERGRPVTEACWLRAEFRKTETRAHYKPPYPELIVMPAFSDLRAGYPVNGRPGRLLGPLFRNGLVNIPRSRVYLPDGTFLGHVKDLEAGQPGGGRRRE